MGAGGGWGGFHLVFLSIFAKKYPKNLHPDMILVGSGHLIIFPSPYFFSYFDSFGSWLVVMIIWKKFPRDQET